MQGDREVVDRLNRLLTDELSAIDQYLVQSLMLENWGYRKLHARIAHEADDERGHAARLVQRILYLDGTPDVAARRPLSIGSGPQEILENDLAFEREVAANLNDAIALCREKGDNGTRALLEVLLRDTEDDHILWLESQLQVIGDVGLENYLAEML